MDIWRQVATGDSPFMPVIDLTRPRLRVGRGDVLTLHTEVKEEYPSARLALRDLIGRAQERDISAYIYVNNRLEGNAIQTIDGIVSRTDL